MQGVEWDEVRWDILPKLKVLKVHVCLDNNMRAYVNLGSYSLEIELGNTILEALKPSTVEAQVSNKLPINAVSSFNIDAMVQ